MSLASSPGSQSALRFGILGCGTIAPAHARAISSIPNAQLVAVADADLPRAQALAGTYGAAPYPGLEAMLRGESLDAVAICTASGLHGTHACEAMRAGLHVMVEKPVDIRLDVVDEMLAVQRQAGVQLGVISQHRFDASSRYVHQLVAEGALGRLVLANAAVLWWRSQAYYDSGEWRGTWELDGGGVLMNQAIHTIDLLLWYMGPVQSVRALTSTLAHQMETEDVAVAALCFRSGALGTMTATTAAYPGVTTRLEILGDAGSAVIERDRLAYLRLARDDSPPVGPFGLETALPADPPGLPEDGTSAHALQYADLVRAIRGGGTPLVDGVAGRRPLELILAIYRSARTGREVELP